MAAEGWLKNQISVNCVSALFKHLSGLKQSRCKQPYSCHWESNATANGLRERETTCQTFSPMMMIGATKNSPTMQSNPFAPHRFTVTSRSSLDKRNNLMANCIAAQTACERAVERWTHSIGIKDNLFLGKFSQVHRHILIGAFAIADREARFSRSSHKQLAAGTIKDTVLYVCATFWENGDPNPSIN